jgi:hypothetical protein
MAALQTLTAAYGSNVYWRSKVSMICSWLSFGNVTGERSRLMER